MNAREIERLRRVDDALVPEAMRQRMVRETGTVVHQWAEDAAAALDTIASLPHQ